MNDGRWTIDEICILITLLGVLYWQIKKNINFATSKK